MATIAIRGALTLLVGGLLFACPLGAQTPTPGPDAAVPQGPESPQAASPEQEPDLTQSAADALRSLAVQLNEKLKERRTELSQKNLTRVAELDLEIQELRWQFASLITQMDVQQFEAPESAQLDLLTELTEALRPVVGVLRDVTDGARREHELKRAIAETVQRLAICREARDKLQATLTELEKADPSRETDLAIELARTELDQRWSRNIARLEHQHKVAEENLKQLQAKQGSWLTSLQDKSEDIGRSALSIVISVAVLLAVLFGLRSLFRLIRGKKRKQTFRGRLTDIVVGAITLVAATAATLAVPYTRGDFVLLTLGLVVVLGTCWVLAKSAPGYIEQIRLFLNIGSVREGERILVDGLPYRVEALRFYSKLRNPELTGGTLRVPIGELIGERSRVAGPDEPWFPCKQGDMVSIEGMIGRVSLQTPETVTFIERNDAPRTYPTAAFLELNPRNLSKGFEVGATFGIDYSHQADSVDKIPDILRTEIENYFAKDPDAAELREVRVEFSEAGSSSLDYRVQVEFTGKAAPRYDALNRMVSQALVNGCSKHGYGIPFPQVQVHGVN